MKRIVCILMMITLLCSALMMTGCGKDYEYVEIKVRDYGSIIVKLDDTYAPITVENFLSLVDAKFYDGLTFHRIIDGFMVQGGCPDGDGTGDAGKTIKGEFSENGVKNPTHHARGVISMARGNQPNSASCQFFICHKSSPHLDGKYAAFGYVVEGIEVVDALCQYVVDNPDVLKDTNGGIYSFDQPVIESIRRIDYAEGK